MLTAGQFRQLADRHTGIGYDQALVLEPPRRANTAVFYRIFNSDGGRGGAMWQRCPLHRRPCSIDAAWPPPAPSPWIVGRDSSMRRVLLGDVVAVDMGVPAFDPRTLPINAPAQADPIPSKLPARWSSIGAVSLGNPHAVLEVDSVKQAPVESLGPAIEAHRRFPKRVNAGFMEVVDPSHIRLRVYERGAGETLACGTGACAAVAVGGRVAVLGSK